MLPIHKLEFNKTAREDGALIIFSRLRMERYRVINRREKNEEGIEEHTKNLMRRKLWDETYGDLITPLQELMFLARWAANSNPSAYPEAARIEELTEKINELLDWRKQMAAAKEKDETK